MWKDSPSDFHNQLSQSIGSRLESLVMSPLQTLVLALYGGCLLLSLIWYGCVVGCSYPSTRYHLWQFCLVPFGGIYTDVPWYLSSWDSQNGHQNYSSQSLDPRLESLVTSPLQVRDLELALRRQLSKLQDIDTNKEADRTLQDLGNL